jgi:hypothetical protein
MTTVSHYQDNFLCFDSTLVFYLFYQKEVLTFVIVFTDKLFLKEMIEKQFSSFRELIKDRLTIL